MKVAVKIKTEIVRTNNAGCGRRDVKNRNHKDDDGNDSYNNDKYDLHSVMKMNIMMMMKKMITIMM